MRRYLIAALIVAVIILLQASAILYTQRTARDLAEAADGAGQRKRPTPTPRPTPRPNMNDGGGVYERGNANSNGNTLTRGEREGRRAGRGHSSSNTNIGTTDANANSDAYTVGETTTKAPTTGRRGRAGSRRRRAPSAPPTMSTTTTGRETTVGALADRAITLDMPADLSGTYAGLLSDEARGMTDEEARLTISGDRYTLKSASLSYSGRFIVNTTRGYHAVTLELGLPAPGQSFAQFISVRARRVGANRLILTSVPGERQRFSFMSRGSNMAWKHQRSRKPYRN